MSLLLADFDRAALRVEGDERIAEQPFDVAAARHIRGRKVAQHGWVDQGDRVAERKGDVQFVRREEDALAVVVCQPSQQRAEFVTVRQVEERGRLVEQDDRGVLGQGPGDHYPLAFAVGHAVHRFSGESCHADQFQRAFHDGFVLFLYASDPVGVGGSSEGYYAASVEMSAVK